MALSAHLANVETPGGLLRHTGNVKPGTRRYTSSGEPPYVGVYLWLLVFLPIAGAVVGVTTNRSEFMLLSVAFWSLGALVTAALLILVSEVVRERRTC